MKKDNQVKFAYLAGLVDGDGCISIRHNTGHARSKRYKGHNLSIIVTQRDGRIMDWLFGNFGGCVHVHFGHHRRKGNFIHEWTIRANKAGELLKHIEPFLVFKREQAQFAIRFQERLTVGNKIRISSSRDEKGRLSPAFVSDHEIAQREELMQKVSDLKSDIKLSQNTNVQNKKHLLQL